MSLIDRKINPPLFSLIDINEDQFACDIYIFILFCRSPAQIYHGKLLNAANVSESITPREYADLLFDGIGAALVFNFKRLKREEFDGLKPKIDWSMVESFPFPASFEEQQYIGDEGKIHVYSWDGQQETTPVGPYSVRELYLDHFGKS